MLIKHTFNSNKQISIAKEGQPRHHLLYLMFKYRVQTIFNAHLPHLMHRQTVDKMRPSKEHIFKNITKRCLMLSTKEMLQT